MADAQSEGLVVLDPGRAATARAAIEAIARVTQTLPPRLLLVVADRTAWERVMRFPACASTMPDDLPADLNSGRASLRSRLGRPPRPESSGRARGWTGTPRDICPPDAPPDAGEAGGTDRDPEEPER